MEESREPFPVSQRVVEGLRHRASRTQPRSLFDQPSMEGLEARGEHPLALGGGSGAAAEPEAVGDVMFLGQSFDGLDPKELRGLANDAKSKLGSGVATFVTVNDGRASVLVTVTDDLTARFSAVDLVRKGHWLAMRQLNVRYDSFIGYEDQLSIRVALTKLSECSFKPGSDENGKPTGGTTEVEYVWKIQ